MEHLKNKKATHGAQAKYAEQIRNKAQETDINNLNVFLLDKEQEALVYNIGVQKFKLGNYQEAQQIFFFLSVCDPNNYTYEKSYAGSVHALGEYKIAYDSYTKTYEKDKINNLDCLYYAAVVLFEMKDYDKSLELFNEFTNTPSENIIKTNFKQSTEMYINMIKDICIFVNNP